MMICESCGQNEVSEKAAAHGYHLCDGCSLVRDCSRCDRQTEKHFIWDQVLCATCQAADEKYAWLDDTEAQIVAVAEANGWTVAREYSGVSEARYLTCTRGGECYIIRVADHEAGRSRDCGRHEEPDFSVERTISPTSHRLEKVLNRLK